MLCSTLDAGEYVKDNHADNQGTSSAAILDLERTFAYTNLGALVWIRSDVYGEPGE
jgi:hypothetical protein